MKMKLYKTIIYTVLLFFGNTICAQQYVEFLLVQPDSLIADAGIDASVENGSSVSIGGTPIAYGGLLPYSQFWKPGIFLDDSTFANPTVTSSYSLAYVLTVQDANNCTSIDTVLVDVTTGNTLIYPNNKNYKPIVIYVPERDILDISFDNTYSTNKNLTVTIADILGKIVYNKLINPFKNPKIQIPTYNFSDVIVVSIKGKNKEWSYKLITRN